MFTLQSLICCTLSPHLSAIKISKNVRPRNLRPSFAQKQDPTENSKTKQEPILSLRVPDVFLARSAVSILGLGFVDAGYSGDWSRIGAISRETEELLKIAAYLVVPFCFFLIFSFSKEREEA